MAKTIIATFAQATGPVRAPMRSWADIAAGRSELASPETLKVPMPSGTEFAPEPFAPDNSNIPQPLPAEPVTVNVVSTAEADTSTSESCGNPFPAPESDEGAIAYIPTEENNTFDGEEGVLAVETSDGAAAKQPLRPGRRGSWQCFCRGEVVMMCAQYGWLAVLGDIDHPDADSHEGHIYVHKRDVVAGDDLVEGDPVSFYLYADKKGLGAEYCCWEDPNEHDFDAVASQDLIPWTQTEDLVSFDFYADEHGVGAEYCCRGMTDEPDVDAAVWQGCMNWTQPGALLRADALEFQPLCREKTSDPDCDAVARQGCLRAGAWEFQPLCDFDVAASTPAWCEGDSAEAHLDAHAFEATAANVGVHMAMAFPTARALKPDALAFVPSSLFASSTDIESGSEADDEDGGCAWSDETSSSLFDGESECVSDAESEDVAVWDAELEAVVISAPLRFKNTSVLKQCASPVTASEISSTCGGEASDSDWEAAVPIKTFAGWVRPPPGLSLLS